ncbi:ABC transporter ATP-binding protein [Sphingorhabdus sp. IMCC26285]|uniref:ABC transporter ATP-binding protein n=1 Tax=Sphingorhabdus profundilacus TaxID=2509718 RepID=A0A6I4M1K7_9SPHN|nr:ABC transporter ATP-binding protein [Sphingorhabdus profundilacus]MVZ96338.1 ABC transporter ATP-binding protein [Sphingorhabdus profundilacus]
MTLQCDNVDFAHGERPALHSVNACFEQGQFSVILGPNGAGKSTLLACLAGLLKPDSGSARLDGRDVSSLPVADRAKMIGLLPQGAETHWAISVQALVALGRYPHRTGLGLSKQDRSAITDALNATGTSSYAMRTVTELSGGERARVLMARVLAGEPQWILADEPLANLDPGYQIDMLTLLRKQADSGKGVVAVLHDLHHAVRYANHVVLLHRGTIFAQGDMSSVITSANLAAVYGIDAQLFTDEKGLKQLLIHGKIAP